MSLTPKYHCKDQIYANFYLLKKLQFFLTHLLFDFRPILDLLYSYLEI